MVGKQKTPDSNASDAFQSAIAPAPVKRYGLLAAVGWTLLIGLFVSRWFLSRGECLENFVPYVEKRLQSPQTGS